MARSLVAVYHLAVDASAVSDPEASATIGAA
jgi:hypothetical protein